MNKILKQIKNKKRKETKMKKLVLISAMLFALSTFASAQTNYSANCDVKVSIIKALSISNYNNSSINFGEIIMDGTTKTGTVANGVGGHFLITGQPGRNVTVTYPSTVALSNSVWVGTNGGTVGSITFTSNTADQTGSTLTYTGQVPMASGTTLPLVVKTPNDGSGYLNVWVGGSISVPGTTPNGDYIGQHQVTVHY